MTEITVGIVRINRDCAFDDTVDRTAIHLVRLIDQGILGYAEVKKVCSVAEVSDLVQKLRKWVDEEEIKLILTLTKVPEDSSENMAITYTESLLDTKLPGLKGVLSHLQDFDARCFLAGIRRKSIIINLPDKLTVARRSLKLLATDVILLTSMFFENIDPELNRINTSTVNNVIQLSVTEADRKLMSFMISLRKIIVTSLDRALNLVLAEDVIYDSEVPPFSVSSVSGYAVVSTDLSREREIIGFCAARQPTDLIVTPGTCVRVQRHAGIPRGADAVIDEQFVDVVDNRIIEIQAVTVTRNMNILLQDSLRGILVKGTLLINTFIRHLRDNNVFSVKVYKMPQIAVFSTCQNQRQFWLISTLKSNGFHGAWNAGICYEVSAWLEELQEAFRVADVAVTVGVSPGHCLLDVLHADFTSNVYSTGVDFFCQDFCGR